MPRFTPSKYDPRNDSTVGFKDLAAQTGSVVLNTKHRTFLKDDDRLGCPCGCEGEPVGAKATFLMGHDARLRGKLIRAHLTDTGVVTLIDGGTERHQSAMSVAEDYGESFVEALKSAVLRRDGKNREVVARALNSKRLIKVGRWQYTGQVVAIFDTSGGEEYEIEYVTKTGELKKARVPASKTEEVA